MEKLATVNIKGKKYVEVHERLRYFREKYNEWGLISEIVSHVDGKIIMKATIYDLTGTPIATGFAYEIEGKGYINKTSYVENCETSAWGRALANFGIGIETSVASSEEVRRAIDQQEPKSKPKPKKISEKMAAGIEDKLKSLIIKSYKDISAESVEKAMSWIYLELFGKSEAVELDEKEFARLQKGLSQHPQYLQDKIEECPDFHGARTRA